MFRTDPRNGCSHLRATLTYVVQLYRSANMGIISVVNSHSIASTTRVVVCCGSIRTANALVQLSILTFTSSSQPRDSLPLDSWMAMPCKQARLLDPLLCRARARGEDCPRRGEDSAPWVNSKLTTLNTGCRLLAVQHRSLRSLHLADSASYRQADPLPITALRFRSSGIRSQHPPSLVEQPVSNTLPSPILILQ
jgi:hypothetical protein